MSVENQFIDSDVLNADSIALIANQLFQEDPHLPANEKPLSYHADNLVSQQAYTGQKDNSLNLQNFVEKIQSPTTEPFANIFSQDESVNLTPFFEQLTTGLSVDELNFQAVCANLRTQFASENVVVDQAPYYFLSQQSNATPSAFQQYDGYNVNQIRKDFPILHQNVHGKPLVWFDNAATTQKPQSVIDAISNFYSHDNSNIHRAAHTLAARSTDAYEGSREKVRDFLGASSTDEIIFVRGTTEGINLIAQTYGRKFIQPGDEILVSELDHHANIVPWQMLAKEKGAILKPIPINDNGDILLDEYTRLLNPRVKIVAFAHANNSLGTILPVKEMIQLAKRVGAKVVVDGAQSVAHIPVNVQELDADFYVFSGHKIFAPTGIGVVYGKKELLDVMPPWQGGGNMIKTVTFEETTFNEAPAKFEAGTPTVADAVGLGAALDYVTKIGLENIARYEHELLVYATEQLKQIKGLYLVGNPKEKVGVLSFILLGKPVEQIGQLLDKEGIAVRAGHHCAQPSLRRFGLQATVRPSLSLYNTKEEVDRLVAAIKKIQNN